MRYKFHHIGLACNDIDKTAEKYFVFGYSKGRKIWDDLQQVTICFLSAEGMPLVELVSSNSESSPIRKILLGNGVTPYHNCFSVKEINESILDLTSKGFTKLFDPVRAVAMGNRRIVFLYSVDSGLIELVEEEK